MLRVLLVELAWLCLLVSSQIAGGVELPGKKANSRFEGVSALRLSVGSAAGEHKFMDVAGYAGVIKGFKSSDPNPIPFKAIVAATLVDRLRLLYICTGGRTAVQPTACRCGGGGKRFYSS